MVYYTGDIHGSSARILLLCEEKNLNAQDTIVILGDVGANYYLDERDEKLKRTFAGLKPTVFCIHGNHEIRPANISTYKEMKWNGGTVWYETSYPNILFAKDGEIYTIDGMTHLVIGGAYSVDKYSRIFRGFGWWEDEQPSEEIKAYVERQIKNRRIDVILSHTCPYRYRPTEAFMPGIDESRIDTSTEEWLDKIEERTDYHAWLCGHWHINKSIDKLNFLYDGVISSQEIERSIHNGARENRERGLKIK